MDDEDKYDSIAHLTEKELKESALRLEALEPRFASLLAILAEQIPVPVLLRAAEIAPAHDYRWRIPQHAWSILSTLENTKQEVAQEKLINLRRVPTSPTQRSSRSGIDPVTAFIFGAVFF